MLNSAIRVLDKRKMELKLISFNKYTSIFDNNTCIEIFIYFLFYFTVTIDEFLY